MILGDVEETVTTIEIDEETYEEIYKVSHAVLVGTFKMSILRIQQLNTYLWKDFHVLIPMHGAQENVTIKSKGFGVGQTWVSSVGLATSYLAYVG